MPRSGRGGWQFRLRDLLVLNVYLAVLVFGVVLALRWAPVFGPLVVPLAGCGIPLTMALLADATTRPGPKRDALADGFTILAILGLAIPLSLPLVLLIRHIAAGSPGTMSPIRAVLRIGLVELSVVLGALWIWVARLAQRGIPASCPNCERRRLVKAKRPESTDRDDYVYAWCLACGSRRKRQASGRAGWLDASAPEDDRHYRLESLGSRLAGRAARNRV